MSKIGIIGYSAKKQKGTMPAHQLYISPLFRYRLLYCKLNYDETYILSAKYGLIELNDIISDYDLSLKSLNKNQRYMWFSKVAINLRHKLERGDILFLHAGSLYREFFYLLPFHSINPTPNLRIGELLSFYKKNI